MNIRYWWHWLLCGIPEWLPSFNVHWCRRCMKAIRRAA